MLPVLFRLPEWLPGLGGQSVTSFGALLLVAFLASGWLLGRELRHRGLSSASSGELVVAAAIGGILGAKLYYLLLHFDAFLSEPVALLLARGGLVWYGGLLGGAAAVAWRARRLALPLPVLADAAAPALALGYALGRIGCFLVGDDYGLPTAFPLGLAFPAGAPPTTPANLLEYFGATTSPAALTATGHVRVHPTQLYEAGLAFGTLALLLWLGRRGASRAEGSGTGAFAPGRLLGLYLVLAGASRFAVEFLRAKDDRLLGPITIAQLLSLVLAAAGAWLLRNRRLAAVPAAPRAASPRRPIAASPS
ncbi:MAG: prolipoprotein diacylglyceryl transferase [Gemmatimonadetes bacterium]|nr:prolipoprotein diacylglyceryl transferase [Gemmatimonadota bacterium]